LVTCTARSIGVIVVQVIGGPSCGASAGSFAGCHVKIR
jgi:hypothetical protein